MKSWLIALRLVRAPSVSVNASNVDDVMLLHYQEEPRGDVLEDVNQPDTIEYIKPTVFSCRAAFVWSGYEKTVYP